MRRLGRDFGGQRSAMVRRQLRGRGIEDERVLSAMEEVPRELFVPEESKRRAYADAALPIGHGQTISQPWIVAAICQALRLDGSEKVLDVGAGSGYSTAVLARLCRYVVAVERIPELASAATSRLEALGVGNARVLEGDGSVGVTEEAPFGAVAIHATSPHPPASLLEQLAPGARLVVPVAAPGVDMLTTFVREGREVPDWSSGAGLSSEVIGPCRFVPLIGAEAFDADTLRAG
ncbi:MAG: protein-L-isoaspartate(D-aspartate) O-methyltransferase [Solirubrobacterales bacterium]